MTSTETVGVEDLLQRDITTCAGPSEWEITVYAGPCKREITDMCVQD